MLLKWKVEHSVCVEIWLQIYRTLKSLQDLARTWTTFVRNATIHTDTLLMISGLLVSYYLYKRLEQTKRLDIHLVYVSRLMRYSTQFCIMCVCVCPD